MNTQSLLSTMIFYNGFNKKDGKEIANCFRLSSYFSFSPSMREAREDEKDVEKMNKEWLKHEGGPYIGTLSLHASLYKREIKEKKKKTILDGNIDWILMCVSILHN